MNGNRKVVAVTRRLPHSGPESLRRAGLEVRVRDSELPPSRAELLAHVNGADALITLVSDTVDEELLEAAGPRLRVVANYAVGYDNVDVKTCTARGVTVTNTPGVLTEATADQTFALLLSAARRLPEGHRLVASGQWQGWHPLQLLGRDVGGSTIGIVGMGRIGTAVARRALGFGMQVLYHNRSPSPAVEEEIPVRYRQELDDLLGQSDFVSLHAPLTPQTRHLIDARALGRMKEDAVLVNTARGALVDERALVEALRSGTIWAAGLDVFEEEPELAPGLTELPNVVLAPHLGSATRAVREEMARLCSAAILSVLAGRRPANAINEVG